MSSETSTVAALATAPVPAGVAVVRISGPEAQTVLKRLFSASRSPLDHPREMLYGMLSDAKGTQVIDNILAVFMPGPNSYTGEDVVELHVHGSPLLVKRVLRSIFALGVEPAEAGEFTKRAFINGKLDLAQAEAVADLIEATSEQALRIAGEQLRGRLSSAVNEVGEPLRDALAEIEAHIDFPDEDISPEEIGKIVLAMSEAQVAVRRLIGSYDYGAVVKQGLRVLLCGYPNAGKSSLLNALLGKERAIVTDIAGTTRDLIEEGAIIGGYRFVFCDSAGISETDDQVEKIGVELAKDRLEWADLALLVIDGSDTEQEWQQLLELVSARANKVWMLTNKIDLNPEAMSTFFCDSKVCSRNFYLSATEGNGLEGLKEALIEEVKAASADQGDANEIVTNERHRDCLNKASQALGRAIRGVEGHSPLEIIAADVRDALSALDEIVGRTWTEDILGRIFSKFCIGK